MGLYGTVWTPNDSRWRGSASFSRAMRTDPDLLTRVTPTDRGVAETVYRQLGGDLFAWNIRRVGQGIAWGLDVTVLLATTVDDAVGPMLRELTATVRRQGLIPVTTERFA